MAFFNEDRSTSLNCNTDYMKEITTSVVSKKNKVLNFYLCENNTNS